MIFMGLRNSGNICENVGPRELSFYRFVGMSMFYGLSYLLHPSHILRSIRNYRNSRSDTVFEERLFSTFRRIRIATATRKSRSPVCDESPRENIVNRPISSNDPGGISVPVETSVSVPVGLPRVGF